MIQSCRLYDKCVLVGSGSFYHILCLVRCAFGVRLAACHIGSDPGIKLCYLYFDLELFLRAGHASHTPQIGGHDPPRREHTVCGRLRSFGGGRGAAGRPGGLGHGDAPT